MVVGIIVSAMLANSACHADEGPKYETSTAAMRTRKLIRGFGNLVFGFVEIPKNINEQVQLLDPFTGTFTGLYQGTKAAGKRMGVGIYEILTFPAPYPKDYRPIIEPEFVLMDAV
jgi:putative exosortase-associated protein (TIGR04073 family)